MCLVGGFRARPEQVRLQPRRKELDQAHDSARGEVVQVSGGVNRGVATVSKECG